MTARTGLSLEVEVLPLEGAELPHGGEDDEEAHEEDPGDERRRLEVPDAPTEL